MSRIRPGPSAALGLCLTLLLLLPALAQTDRLLDSLRPTGYVNDFAGVFQPGQAESLETFLEGVDRQTHAQISVVVLPSLEGDEISDFANRLFERWQIGHKDDNLGLLFLAALEEKRIWVEVGYGLEPVLTDAGVGRLLDENVIPFFRTGAMADGLTRGVVVAAHTIAASQGVVLDLGAGSPAVQSPPSQQINCGQLVIGAILLIILIPIVIRNPWILLLLLNSGGRSSGGGFGGGGFGGGGFGGFGGGASGGGGAGRSW